MTTVCIQLKVNEHHLLRIARPTAKAIVRQDYSQQQQKVCSVSYHFPLELITLLETQGSSDQDTKNGITHPGHPQNSWPPLLLRTLRPTHLEFQIGKQTTWWGWVLQSQTRGCICDNRDGVTTHFCAYTSRFNIYEQVSLHCRTRKHFYSHDEQLQNTFLTALKDWGHHKSYKKQEAN